MNEMFDCSSLIKWTGGKWLTFEPQEGPSGISIDSRTIKHGELFIAIAGENFDGHNFVESAIQKGAWGVCVDKELEVFKNIRKPVLLVNNTLKALQNIAAGWRKELGIEIVAVTGSVGKTTVKEMIADMLATTYNVVRTRGNWNNDIGLPLSIFNLTRETELGVFELGMNHPDELQPLCDILKPDFGVITAIGPVHIEFFESEEAIAKEKATLFKNLPDYGIAFFHSDAKFANLLENFSKHCSRITAALSDVPADYKLVSLKQDHTVEIMENSTGEHLKFVMPLPGKHNVANAILAIAVARAKGVSWQNIQKAIENFKGEKMRWEHTYINNVFIINDAYNANPISMTAAIETFAKMQVQGKKWLCLAGMLELGSIEQEAHIEIGKKIDEFFWDGGIVLLGKRGAIIREGITKNQKVHLVQTHLEAAQILAEQTKASDAVLLKASRGERMEKVLEKWLELIEKSNTP